jgi:hypothetical protein
MAQAEALAASMTDTLATKQDLRELEVRLDARFAAIDARFLAIDARFGTVDSRFDNLEKHVDNRLVELEKRFEHRLEAGLANLERRITLRMLAAVGSVAALVKLL